MAGAACKIIIDGALTALMESLRQICTDANLHGGKLDAAQRSGYLDRLAKLDLTHYDGAMADKQNPDSLLAIMGELEGAGVLSPDVWRVYHRFALPVTGAA